MDDFNIRVYGVLIRDDNGGVLLSREIFRGVEMVKFPGGGLKIGEGIVDCLKREWKEELNVELSGYDHFYTTEFYQKSAFDDRQIVSIYYRVKLAEMNSNFTARLESKEQEFFWLPIDEKLSDQITFPIDKEVGRKLNEWKHGQ